MVRARLNSDFADFKQGKFTLAALVRELHQVIKWLTGYDAKKLASIIKNEVTFEDFFKKAKLNRNAHLIRGTICGYRNEDIEDPLMQQVRYLDKFVVELANGKKLEKILRASE